MFDYLSARSVEQDHYRQVVEALRHSAEQIPSHGRAANPLIQTKTILKLIFSFYNQNCSSFLCPLLVKNISVKESCLFPTQNVILGVRLLLSSPVCFCVFPTVLRRSSFLTFTILSSEFLCHYAIFSRRAISWPSFREGLRMFINSVLISVDQCES